MIEKVKRYAEKWHMLEKEDRIIVGVSGGADSVCLLFVLSELKKEVPFELFVVHVNHELRGEAAKDDEEFVRRMCKEWEVPFFVYSENVELIAKKRKQSTEEAGRELRRACFQNTMEKVNANKIALAHHKNDNAETVLMNLTRGTGLKGLGGIRPVQGEFIRPLLCVSRKEIELYLQEKELQYCHDITNESDDYTRNRVRNHVIPYLECEINSAAVHHIGETSEQLQQLQDFLEQTTQNAFNKAVAQEENSYVIKGKEFAQLHLALKPLLIKMVLQQLAKSEKDIEQTHLKAIQELFAKQVGKSIDLPYRLTAKRVYEGVKIQYKRDFLQDGFQRTISLETGRDEFVINARKVRCELSEYNKENEKCSQKSGKQCFDYGIIQNGLTVRTRRPGDYITIHSDGRTQKLKSFFINEKVPQEMRDQVLLVADGSHIMWIVGMRVNCLYQVSHRTKYVLEIQIDEGVHYGREN